MNKHIENFTQQLSEAIEIGSNARLSVSSKAIKNVIITGLGGSGIGGTIVTNLVEQEARVPIQVNKTYTLPEYVNEHTLVIVSSYSGNTEETLSAFKEALAKKAQIICITSGGKVHEIAKIHGFNLITIPAGLPPRAAFAYSFTQLLFCLYYKHLINDAFCTQLSAAVDLLDNEEKNIIKEAKKISKLLTNKLPVIYSDASFEGVAIRFRQQVNENAKMLCWHHVFPEMNHNELVGWTKKDENLAVVLFRNETDSASVKKRMEICKTIFSKYTSTIVEVWSKGDSAIERALYCIHLGDWASYYLAKDKDIDSVEVKVIDYLKKSLQDAS